MSRLIRRGTALCIIGLLAVEPLPAQVPEGPSPTPLPTDDLGGLSIEELIKLLPPAGLEWTFDRGRMEWKEGAASKEMARRLIKEALTDEQWRKALVETGALRFRDRWPRDAEYAISITVPRWLGVAQIRVKPRIEGLSSAQAGALMSSWSGTFAMIDERDARIGRAMGKVPDGVKEIVFDIEVERGTSWTDTFEDEGKEKAPKPGLLWKGSIARSVHVVESPDDVLPPCNEPGIDDAVRDAVGAGFREWGQERRLLPFVVIDPDCLRFPVLAKTALDIKVELLDEGKVIAETWLVANDADTLSLTSSISKAPRKFYGSGNLKVDRENPDTKRWVLRFTGRGDHYWCFWSATHRWAGSFEVPWDKVVKHEEERVGAGGRGPEFSTPYYK